MTRTEAEEALRDYTTEAAGIARRLGIESDEFTLQEVVYWFAVRNYVGQGCTLYAVSCVSEYTPGPFVTFESLPDDTREIITAMEGEG